MRTVLLLCPMLLATYMPGCDPAVHPTAPPAAAERMMAELWRPVDTRTADLFNGPWGTDYAPDSKGVYRFVKEKTHGVSPGMTVKDPEGVEWSVKQGDEGPVEVTLSRVLSALGYHQPPVYFVPAFSLDHGDWTERAPGGRFRPKLKELKEKGAWMWEQNPFVGTKPYQGLLVIMLMFNSSDLKDSNNSVYELRKSREGATRWLVVRDIGTALGETGKLSPKRNDPEIFDGHPFIDRVKDGVVEFSYHGWHQNMIQDRITPAEVRWACELASKLTDQQWADAFRAGGYDPAVARRFIARLKAKIQEGLQLAPPTPTAADGIRAPGPRLPERHRASADGVR